MADLHLVQLDLDLRTLGRQTHRMSLPGTDDSGYPVHAALEAVFGPKVLRPFSAAPRGAPRGVLPVLAYSERDAEALIDHAQRYAEAAWYQTVAWDSLATKPMPSTWAAGDLLGFEVRACPIVRSTGPAGNAREVDAFLAKVHSVDKDVEVDREEVYRAWLQAQLESRGVQVDADKLAVRSFRRARLIRRTQGSDRKARKLERPDVRFEGELTVTDPAAFDALLRRGVGRHRAFGFGMLLLRPPRR